MVWCLLCLVTKQVRDGDFICTYTRCMRAGAYNYWVPAAVLGMRFPEQTAAGEGADTSVAAMFTTDASASLSAEDAAHNAAVMGRLRDTLNSFLGDRPFHNYTKRQRYIPGKNKPQRGQKPRKRVKSEGAESDPEGDISGTMTEQTPHWFRCFISALVSWYHDSHAHVQLLQEFIICTCADAESLGSDQEAKEDKPIAASQEAGIVDWRTVGTRCPRSMQP